MRVAQSRVTSQGQISIPSAVRKDLDIGPGSELIWERRENGEYVVRPKRRSLRDVHAILGGIPIPCRTEEELMQARREFWESRSEHPIPDDEV